MDTQRHPSTNENLLYGETSTASPSHIQLRPDENFSTASTACESNGNVVESV